MVLRSFGVTIFLAIYFFLSLCFLGSNSSLAESKNSKIVQNRSEAALDLKDFGSDLPTVGSSLFDKIFSYEDIRGHRIYSLPFPLAKLVHRLKSATAINTDPEATILPFSRSLQRPGDFTDLPWQNPRLVFGLARSLEDAKSSQMFSHKIFFGYNEKKDQMEVISFNDEAGRFEFQIVHNYSNRPQVSYAPRSQCLSCHQNQAPIFSVNPWADAIHPFNQELFGTAFLLAQPKNGEETLKLNPHHFSTSVSNFPAAIYNAPLSNSIMNLDFQVRSANRHFEAQRVWRHGCKNSISCRQVILLKNFVPEIFLRPEYVQQASEYNLDKIKTFVRNNLRPYNVADDQISSRDPGLVENYKLAGKALGLSDDLVTDIRKIELHGTLSRWLQSDELALKLIKGLNQLTDDSSSFNPNNNPATPRVRTDANFVGIAITNAFDHQSLVRSDLFGPLEASVRLEIIQTLFNNHPDFFAESAFNVFKFEELVTKAFPTLNIRKQRDLNFQ